MSTSLEKQAAGRKARLAELRNLKRKRDGDVHVDKKQETEKNESEVDININRRNFDQSTRGPVLGFENNPIQISEIETVELLAGDLQKQALESLSVQTSSETALKLDSLQPKRANWDLKRDLEPSLQILEARTNNAIIRSVRERVKKAAVV